MRPLGTIGTWRAAPRALAAFVALALSSGAAFAMCTGTPGVYIQASDGETCQALGTYTSTEFIAGLATGGGSVRNVHDPCQARTRQESQEDRGRARFVRRSRPDGSAPVHRIDHR